MPDAIFVFIRYPFNSQSLVFLPNSRSTGLPTYSLPTPPEQIVHFKSPVSLAARRSES